MSQENVELVRRYFDALARGFQAYWKDPRSAVDRLNAGEIGPEGVEMARYVNVNAEWRTVLTGVTYRGYVGLAQGFDQLVEAAQDYRIELKEANDLGGQHVLAVVESSMRGKASEIEVKALIFMVLTVHDGLIIRMEEYLERAQALEAAGVSE
jgi:ketosteroid isomerase-like protein